MYVINNKTLQTWKTVLSEQNFLNKQWNYEIVCYLKVKKRKQLSINENSSFIMKCPLLHVYVWDFNPVRTVRLEHYFKLDGWSWIHHLKFDVTFPSPDNVFPELWPLKHFLVSFHERYILYVTILFSLSCQLTSYFHTWRPRIHQYHMIPPGLCFPHFPSHRHFHPVLQWYQ